ILPGCLLRFRPRWDKETERWGGLEEGAWEAGSERWWRVEFLERAKTRRRNQRKPLGWLGSCLCVSTVQVDLDAAEAAHGQQRSTGQRQRRQEGLGVAEMSTGSQNQRLLQKQQQQQQCLYCMQTDCRILYDDVARTGSECGSSCFRGYAGGGAGGSFRMPTVSGRGAGSISMSGVPEESSVGRDVDREADAASSMGQQLDLRSAAAPNKSSSLAAEEPAAANRGVEGDRCVREV
uniref:FLZ-type domain-containing protein n=1 Tax=Macrostomum lignano TaxID=282301 RepID=A0A1I8HZV8_9PLAT